ncbi:hypothetical protein HDU96_005533 [Phlyctochytrium bullatum]|nr:hypothetical protein HDU96_005533 [Phlyctochytrium bullatum]
MWLHFAFLTTSLVLLFALALSLSVAFSRQYQNVVMIAIVLPVFYYYLMARMVVVRQFRDTDEDLVEMRHRGVTVGRVMGFLLRQLRLSVLFPVIFTLSTVTGQFGRLLAVEIALNFLLPAGHLVAMQSLKVLKVEHLQKQQNVKASDFEASRRVVGTTGILLYSKMWRFSIRGRDRDGKFMFVCIGRFSLIKNPHTALFWSFCIAQVLLERLIPRIARFVFIRSQRRHFTNVHPVDAAVLSMMSGIALAQGPNGGAKTPPPLSAELLPPELQKSIRSRVALGMTTPDVESGSGGGGDGTDDAGGKWLEDTKQMMQQAMETIMGTYAMNRNDQSVSCYESSFSAAMFGALMAWAEQWGRGSDGNAPPTMEGALEWGDCLALLAVYVGLEWVMEVGFVMVEHRRGVPIGRQRKFPFFHYFCVFYHAGIFFGVFAGLNHIYGLCWPS